MYRIVGRLRNGYASIRRAAGGIPTLFYWDSNERRNESLDSLRRAVLTGAVASERATEAPKGSLSADGNRAKSVKAEEGA